MNTYILGFPKNLPVAPAGIAAYSSIREASSACNEWCSIDAEHLIDAQVKFLQHYVNGFYPDPVLTKWIKDGKNTHVQKYGQYVFQKREKSTKEIVYAVSCFGPQESLLQNAFLYFPVFNDFDKDVYHVFIAHIANQGKIPNDVIDFFHEARKRDLEII